LIELDLENLVWRVNSSWKATYVDYVDFDRKWSRLAEKGMVAVMESQIIPSK